jgi:hypothetical protein
VIWGRGPCLPPSPPVIVTDTYDLYVVALYRSTFFRHFDFLSSLAPAIGTDGRDSLVAWFDGYPERGGRVLAAKVDARGIGPSLLLGLFGPEPVAIEKPSVATDGERYVVVWQDKLWFGTHDIRGAVVESDRITRFTVAESEAEEEHPSVVAVGRGRFLVAYQWTKAGERRIAGRFIEFRGPRQRPSH